MRNRDIATLTDPEKDEAVVLNNFLFTFFFY